MLLVGVLLTGLVYLEVEKVERQAAERKFDDRAETIADYISDRFSDYTQLLRAGVAVQHSSDDVSRDEWRRFVSTMKIENSYPGTQGVGYAQWLTPEQVPAFTAAIRVEGFPAFQVHPEGPRDSYTSIVFLEPFDARNQRAFGFDMYSEAVRREAMQRALVSGDAALTGRVVLLQETEIDRQYGTLLYLPVYRGDAVPATARERRSQIEGFVYSPLRMNDLIEGVLGNLFPDVWIRISDRGNDIGGGMMFQSAEWGGDPAQAQSGWRRVLTIGGREWLIEAAPSAALVPTWSLSRLMLLLGVMISLLMSVVLWAVVGARDRAAALAGTMSEAFRQAMKRQQAVLDSAADTFVTVDSDGCVRSANRAAERLFRRTEAALLKMPIDVLLPQFSSVVGNLSSSSGIESVLRSESEARDAKGRLLPVEVTVSRLEGEHRDGSMVVAVRDLTEIRSAQAELVRAHTLRASILSHAPFAIVSADASAVVTELNLAAEQMLWKRRDQIVGKVTLPDLLGGDEHCEIEPLLQRIAPGQVDERECTYRRSDGTAVLVNQMVTTLRAENDALIGYLVIAYDISERKQAEAYIRHLAHHDPLTELPNRMLLTERLDAAMAQARQQHQKFGLLMIDLDHFKRINDSLGHHVGDELLVQVTARLRASVTLEDTVARMGGDEFVIVRTGVESLNDVLAYADELVDRLARPITIGMHELHVTPSVGVCMFPDDGADTITLLKNADAAMYDAKARGRNGFSVFSLDMLRASERKMKMESDLRRAIAERRLELYYQPLVSLTDGEVTGMEALLRWPLGNGEFVAPDVFIPIAEETGLINLVADDLLQRACIDAVSLSQTMGRPLVVAVNISPRQFRDTRLVESVRSALSLSGLAPQLLTLEITERVLIADPGEAAEILGRLRRIGVGVAIDDFGTGYSSLAYISQFPISTLKIDRSFIRDLGEDSADTAVINAVIAMGRSMHLRVVAEGVESPAQWDYLKARGCNEVQGFLFSPGVPVCEFGSAVSKIERKNYPVKNKEILVNF